MLEIIEKKRVERGLSVKRVAEMSGVPETTYNNIVKGRSKNPSFATVLALGTALGISLNDMISAADDSVSTEVVVDLRETEQAPVAASDLASLSDTYVRLMDQQERTHKETIAANAKRFEAELAAREANFQRERDMFREALQNEYSHRQSLYKACGALALSAAVSVATLVVYAFTH